MKRLLSILLLAAIALVQNASAASVESPQAVTKALYHADMANPGFAPDTIKACRPYLTPQLYSRLLKKARLVTQPGDAGAIDGDVFLYAQDVPLKIEVGNATIDQTKAKVEVMLAWSGEDKRHFTVLLTQINGAWKVYDINYGGKDGSLTDLLK